jgi:UDP-N-acetylmuramate--alanine ligase
MYNKKRNIHFIGIGGSGMSGIAELLLNLGHKVTGSDLASSEITKRLSDFGAVIYKGHTGTNIDGAEVVVISSAVKEENPEICEARKRKIPVIQRAEMLAELMRLKYGIAIAGSHGKSTTTSIIGSVLTAGGLDPTIVVGGRLKGMGTGAKLGRGEFLVAEADESDGSFLRLTPAVVVVTNIDIEHLDHYGNIEAIKNAFTDFINLIPFYGQAVLCVDDENVREVISRFGKRHITYGFSKDAEITAVDIRHCGENTYFTALRNGEILDTVEIKLSGRHNVLNALASIAVGLEFELPFSKIKEGLQNFRGVQRRLQIKGEKSGVTVIDDYGHHPTEIKATLNGIRDGWPSRRIIAVFQPHRYTRTRDLKEEFFTAFEASDDLIITSIYSAGEEPISGVTGEMICEGIRKSGHKQVQYIKESSGIVQALRAIAKPGDIVITMGAGDIWKTGEEYLDEK